MCGGCVRPPKRGLGALAVHVEEFATNRTLLQRPQAFVALFTYGADASFGVFFAVFAAAAAFLAILAIDGLAAALALAALALAADRLAALATLLAGLCRLQRRLAR